MTKTEAIAKAGGVSALAKVLGISPQAVSKWPDNTIPPLSLFRLKECRPTWFRKRAKKAA